MLVAIICIGAVVLALGWLSIMVGGLTRRIKDLDVEIATARKQVAELNTVLAQVPGRSS